MAKTNTPQPVIGNRLLSPPQYRSMLGMSRSGEYRATSDGLLTKPIYAGPRSRKLPEHEVEIIRQAQIAGATEDEIREAVKALMAARKNQDWRKMLAEVV